MKEIVTDNYTLKSNAYVNWSGGKDSALALYKLMQSNQYDIKYLLTVINESDSSVPMQSIDSKLIEAQSKSMGISLLTVYNSIDFNEKIYSKRMEDAVKFLLSKDINTAIFGDIFLSNIKNIRETKLNQFNVRAEFPLWEQDSKDLIKYFVDSGFKAIVTSVDSSKLGTEFLGKIIDYEFIYHLPANVDKCGENGEYHSFVFDGPIFKQPVLFDVLDIVRNKIDDYVVLNLKVSPAMQNAL